MREIDMSARSMEDLPVNTFLIYGAAKSAKTTFAGTSPRPLFFSDISEHGFESLREENWNEEVTPLFESGVRPIVWGFEKEADIPEMVERARPLVSAGLVRTVWVDSLTFLSDLIFNSILMAQTKRDSRQAYNELGTRLRNVRIKVASLNVAHGWLAHVQHPSEDHPVGGPLIPGSQVEKFTGGVDFVWHTKFEQSMPSKPGVYNIYTQKYFAYPAGNRLGGRAAQLPSPMQGTYADFLGHIGYDVDAIRASLVPIEKARANAKVFSANAAKAAAATPPVAAASTPTVTVTKPTGIVIKKVG